MYEDRKDKALKTIVKKEAKLNEITNVSIITNNQLLNDEIMPKLEKLREAKRVWMEFQQIETELEKTKQLIVAYEYYHFDKKIASGDEQYNYLKTQLDNLEEVKVRLEEEIQELDSDYTKVIEERQKVLLPYFRVDLVKLKRRSKKKERI